MDEEDEEDEEAELPEVCVGTTEAEWRWAVWRREEG